MSDRDALFLIGERDRVEERRGRRLGAAPALAVVVGSDDEAAVADSDDALAGALGVDQREPRDDGAVERPRVGYDALGENGRRRERGGGQEPAGRTGQRVPTPRRLAGV